MPSPFVNLLVDVATETTLALVRTAVDAINAKLPADPATVTAQGVGNASLASLDGKTVAVNTGAVVVASSALPADAATATLQGTGNTSLGTIAGAVGANDVALPAGVVIEAGIGSAAAPSAVTSGRAVRAWRTLAGAAYTALLGADGAAIASASNGVPVVAQTSSTWDISDRAARLIGAIAGANGSGVASVTNAVPTGGVDSGGTARTLLTNASGALQVGLHEGTAYTSSAAELSAAISASPTRLSQVRIQNLGGSTRYAQLFNATSLPGNGAVPVALVGMATNSSAAITFAIPTNRFSTGCTIGCSSTQGTLTIVATNDFLIAADKFPASA